ncbi:normocyte-binding protein [Paenibacillus xylanexedens]|uniref:normocyte-binding protein n=1 Tax=Paenibacillus xylanexedens TaxID=528191 RepID=UPI00119F18B4|nr:normocyte-binding protein [Paenibacillus xylanexedens]
MKDIIRDRLNKMEDLEQRSMLKNLMTGVFLNLVEYQETLNKQIEQRVFDEVLPQEERHDVYVTLCAHEDLDPIHEFLYPILPEDAVPQKVYLSEASEALSRKEEMKLFTCYMECGHRELQSLLHSNRTFRGEIVTSEGRHAITVRLKPSTAYISKVEELYRVFRKNSLPWKSVNAPYIFKFVDCVLVSSDDGDEWDKQQTVKELSIHLEEFESYKRTNMIPLWNIQKLDMKTGGFPVPASDRINYEHVLPLRKTGTEHGYLVDGEESHIRYIKRSEEEITIVSPLEKSDSWTVLKVAVPVATRISRMDYPLFSNNKREGFAGKYARQEGRSVRSKGEIARMIHAFQSAEGLELEDVQVVAPGSGLGITYPLNEFVSDHVRVEADKHRMILRFSKHEIQPEMAIFLDDLLSFLVSEIQLAFPEYCCEGEWV